MKRNELLKLLRVVKFSGYAADKCPCCGAENIGSKYPRCALQAAIDELEALPEGIAFVGVDMARWEAYDFKLSPGHTYTVEIQFVRPPEKP